MNITIKQICYWFLCVSRGYTLPMSLMPSIIAFVWCLKFGGNVVYGSLAILGVICAHLGTNVFDDFVDHILKTPKQACKTKYLEEGFTTPKKILVLAFIYFGMAALVGVFLTLKCGYVISILALLGTCICLAYPKLNNVCLGELALGAAFGPLLFIGFSYAMLKTFNLDLFLASFSVSIFIVVLLIAHALMDFDFDQYSGKKTFCTIIGSKKKALIGLFGLIGVGYFLTFLLIFYNIFPIWMFCVVITIPLCVSLYKSLNKYINETDETKKNFMESFKIARNLSIVYNVILLMSIIFN